MDLEKQNRLLKKKLIQMKKELEKAKMLENSLKNIFTEGQIKKLKNPNKKQNWSDDDISAAVSLHSSSARAYRFLYRKKYPLPAPSTLRRWVSNIKLQSGILKESINLMKNTSLNEKEKLCILSFDEMKIKKCYEYDKVNDFVPKPSNYVQVIMVRGIFKNWRQPVFYNYDCKMTSDIISDVIKKLHSIRYTVTALVSDLGPTNQAVYNELGINTEKTWFTNPADENLKIFVFSDVPHLIKLLRNHFLDTGFILDGCLLNKDPIEQLLKNEKFSDLKIGYKITQEHIEVTGCQRQKVKFATQLFSHSVSMCIKRCYCLELCTSSNSVKCAEFIKIVNDWFDVFNSKTLFVDSRQRTMAFGLALDSQITIINLMDAIINSIRVPNRKTLFPFQRGILISNRSLKDLYTYLREKYEIKFILTNRLNQDILENFFSLIRAKGGLHDHPSAIEFKYRLRSYIVGKFYSLF